MALNIEYNHQSKRVKVTPGTVMFAALEAAREQFALDATRQYQLVHRGKPVELSLPFRLTGISNNAALELREVGAAEVQQVRVCVQLPDGKRQQAAFAHDAALERILASFGLLPSDTPFSLSFLRREIEFDAFATTTLKELGILSGSAIFRVQGASLQGSSAAPVSTAQEEQKRSVSFTATTGAAPPPPVATPLVEAAVPPEAPQPTSNESIDDIEMEESDTTDASPSMTPFDALQLIRDSHFDSVSKGTIRTLMKIVTNILSNPENEKMQAIRLSNAAFQRSVGQCKGGLEFLSTIGFQLNQETETISLQPLSTPKKRVLEDALQLLCNEAEDLGIAAEDRPAVVAPPSADPNFDVFKPQITRMQMQPRGPSTTEVLVGTLKTKQEKLLANEKPPRNTTVALDGLRYGSSGTLDGANNPGAGPTDAQLLVASMKARRNDLEKSMNFRTQAMRELDELKRKKVFQTALIRVQFPDKAVLQATFHPNERVQDVVEHVKECLDPALGEVNFYLYVSPPLQKLVLDKTLTDSSLVPAALVYLSWETKLVGGSKPGFYLRTDLVESTSSESKDEPTNPLEVSYPKPLALEEPSAPAAPAVTAPPAESKRSSSSATTKSGKKPAWLKL